MDEDFSTTSVEINNKCPWSKTKITYNIITEEGYDWFGHYRSYTYNDSPKYCPNCKKRIFL